MGVSHRPGFGLLGSVPRSLSTQPPFATQVLTIVQGIRRASFKSANSAKQ